jgi:hypothetical protein
MIPPNKAFLCLSLLLLSLHSVAQAELNRSSESSQLHFQIQQLQTQIVDINARIIALENAKQDTASFRNSEEPLLNSRIQPYEPNTNGRRTSRGYK